MRTIYYLLLLLFISTCSCTTKYRVVKLNGDYIIQWYRHCGAKNYSYSNYIADKNLFSKLNCDTGVWVRMKNSGKYDIGSFSFNLDSARYTFIGLRPGDATLYQCLPYFGNNLTVKPKIYTKGKRLHNAYFDLVSTGNVHSRKVNGKVTINVSYAYDTTARIGSRRFFNSVMYYVDSTIDE